MIVDESGWECTKVDGSKWELIKADESGWEWMKVDGSGWEWMKVDESGWEWMKVDESGWKCTKVDGSGWCQLPYQHKEKLPDQWWFQWRIESQSLPYTAREKDIFHVTSLKRLERTFRQQEVRYKLTSFNRNKFSLKVPTHPVNVIINSIEPMTNNTMAGSELRLSIPRSAFSCKIHIEIQMKQIENIQAITLTAKISRRMRK